MEQKPLAFLRFSMVLVFLWFGYQQVAHPVNWIYFLPEWTSSLPLSAETFVQLNGAMELVLGAALAVGFFTRISAFILAAHLLVIALHVRDAIGVRDAGLAAATFAVAWCQPDRWTLDAKRKAKKSAAPASAPAAH
jgi:uncharacterized membrane protein YphA (DoxX/SURF4 family)